MRNFVPIQCKEEKTGPMVEFLFGKNVCHDSQLKESLTILKEQSGWRNDPSASFVFSLQSISGSGKTHLIFQAAITSSFFVFYQHMEQTNFHLREIHKCIGDFKNPTTLEDYQRFSNGIESIFISYHCALMKYLIAMLQRQKGACSPIAFLRWSCNGGRDALLREASNLLIYKRSILDNLQQGLRDELSKLTPIPILVAFDEAQQLLSFPNHKNSIPWSDSAKNVLDANGRLTNGTSFLAVPVRAQLPRSTTVFIGTEYEMVSLVNAASKFMKIKPTALTVNLPWGEQQVREFFEYYLCGDILTEIEPFYPLVQGRARLSVIFLEGILEELTWRNEREAVSK